MEFLNNMDILSNTETIGWAITAIAVAGVVLNNRRHRACFVLWLASNALSACVHASAAMYALAVRDAIFFALAIHGWFAWRGPKGQKVEM